MGSIPTHLYIVESSKTVGKTSSRNLLMLKSARLRPEKIAD